MLLKRSILGVNHFELTAAAKNTVANQKKRDF